MRQHEHISPRNSLQDTITRRPRHGAPRKIDLRRVRKLIEEEARLRGVVIDVEAALREAAADEGLAPDVRAAVYLDLARGR